MRIVVILLCMICQHVFAKDEIVLTLPSQMMVGTSSITSCYTQRWMQ